jgi:ribosomal protein S3
VGLKTQLVGRIRGSNRSRTKEMIWGNLGLQDRLRRVETNSTAVNSRYGTLGVKVISAYKRVRVHKTPRILINKINNND